MKVISLNSKLWKHLVFHFKKLLERWQGRHMWRINWNNQDLCFAESVTPTPNPSNGHNIVRLLTWTQGDQNNKDYLSFKSGFLYVCGICVLQLMLQQELKATDL